MFEFLFVRTFFHSNKFPRLYSIVNLNGKNIDGNKILMEKIKCFEVEFHIPFVLSPDLSKLGVQYTASL